MRTAVDKMHFPGGTALTRLCVYDWPSEDGASGGTPHMHTASTEAYLVLAGSGRVETLNLAGYEEHELAPGTLLWFAPGTVHRLVNTRDLEILVIMQNRGLPEAGDAVMTFLSEVLEDPKRYTQAAVLDPSDLAGSARNRRDAALEGYLPLKAAAQEGDLNPLRQFQQSAAALIAPRVDHWKELWRESVLAETAQTSEWLENLSRGRFHHFEHAGVAHASARTGLAHGMCGRLQTWGDARAT